MRETFNSYLSKLRAHTKNSLTPLSTEQTMEDKESDANTRQRKIEIPQGKVIHHVHLARAKSKKHHTPFIALTLVLVFAGICVLSLLALQPAALAANLLPASSVTPTPGIPEAAPQDQSIAVLKGEGNYDLSYGTSCVNLRLGQPLDTAGDKFCWNQDDFTWADRDITCLYNDMHGPGAWWTVNIVDKNDKALNITLGTPQLNQNTCTDNSKCVSDNASRNDANGTQLSDQVGGDDILCGNNACINDQHGTTTECGDPNGKQRVYDRFACQMVDDHSQLEASNPKQPPASEPNANFFEKTWWWSVGVAINPSSYDPNDALYLPTSNLRAADIEPDSSLYETAGHFNTDEPTDHMPECDASGHWSCKNDANIIIYQYNGALTQSTDANHTGSYEEAVPHYSPAQFGEWAGVGNSVAPLAHAYNPGSAPVPVYWVVCSSQGGWAFPCSDPASSANMPIITPDNQSQSLTGDAVAESVIAKDWLSGNADPNTDNSHITLDPNTSQPKAPQPSSPGHLVYTYLNDTVYQPGIQLLFGYSMALGFVLITPVLILIGYQFIWASWTLGRANAMEAFGQIILSISAIAVSYELAAMLIGFTNTFNTAIVNFHIAHGYQPLTIDGQTSSFTLQGQGENDPASFRGIVIPITRWGCVANDFIALVANKFWTDMAGYVPFVGGLAKLIGTIFNAIDVAKHIGEFATLILTMMLCTQVFMRVLLLNYYILTGPIAFGCWGLPGGVGQKVVSSWTKGFVSLLFAQTAQVFVLATFPLILPPFPYFPSDRFGILDVLLQALPRILVLSATIKVPTVMGTGATKAIAQAGTVVGGAVAAAGAAAMQAV